MSSAPDAEVNAMGSAAGVLLVPAQPQAAAHGGYSESSVPYALRTACPASLIKVDDRESPKDADG